ncbi:HPP family protein [Hansschlegelia plantiphila]|uniref:Membrane protein n=1 Tax=Hansschlegelia plantiphila TaxID=374655 RepID=A0A9W6J232_9HYPH|nr:HPP family protein [Hansschlegelia plantiphila]GLK68313.1 membrane protein [Hansschlegelia plantiphila]
MTPQLRDFVPDPASVGLSERFRSASGALVGILATGLLSRAAVGDASALPVLIAPMGASAVLLFAVPASPLAQPWSIVGGNLVAGLVGVTAATLIADPFVAAAVAVGCAIALMMALRCLHPPSGAVALTAVLGGPAITSLGYQFVFWPVLANSFLLLATALLFNNLTGRAYPRGRPRAADRKTTDPQPLSRVGFTSSDLDAALRDYGQFLDVSRGDLEAIMRQTQLRSYRPRRGPLTCAEIMSRDVVAITPDAPLKDALELLRSHHVKMLPVTDGRARVLGVVTQTDLLDKAVWGTGGPRLGVRQRIRLTLSRTRAPNGVVADIMATAVRTVRPETPIAEIVLRMSAAGLHHLPVVGADEKLAGVVSQGDLAAALLADAVDRARATP